MTTAARLCPVGTAAIALAIVGCGAAPEDSGEAVGTAAQAFGEDTCALVPNNHAFTNPSPNSVGPTSATYGHQFCPNQYVVDSPATAVIQEYRVTYRGGVPTPAQMPCNAMWAVATLYGGYPENPFFVRLTDPVIVYGTQSGNTCIAPTVNILPAAFRNDALYRVVAAAGAIFSFQPLQVVRAQFVP
ncbi:MAG TPA: hypothetical protein VK524_03375 [Polyangiaceae bacterium]|nr:hypothetical protein [Polyangiaceae bacterium]